jgi:hypothetical protein
MSEEEALKLVTLNPARQLGIDGRVGSLEAGKDADFVIWSGHPLSTYSIVLETWIDGRKYFDRQADLAAREAVAAEREALLAKARAAKGGKKEREAEGKPGGESPPAPQEVAPAEPPPPQPSPPASQGAVPGAARKATPWPAAQRGGAR